jgi:hypothetical protein
MSPGGALVPPGSAHLASQLMAPSPLVNSLRPHPRWPVAYRDLGVWGVGSAPVLLRRLHLLIAPACHGRIAPPAPARVLRWRPMETVALLNLPGPMDARFPSHLHIVRLPF